MLPPVTCCPPNRLIPSRCPCESRPLVEDPPPFLCAISNPLCELDAADLDGRVALPMAALNLVLSAGLELQYLELRTAYVLQDPSGHLGSRNRFAEGNFLVITPDGNDAFKYDLAADLSLDSLDLNRLTRLDTVLLAATANHRVHAASR